MPVKVIQNSDLGEIRIYKRKGTGRVSIRIAPSFIRVTQPKWMPFTVGEKFVSQNKDWILNNLESKNENKLILENGMQIGKLHTIYFLNSNNTRKQVKNNIIQIKYNANIYRHSSSEVQLLAKKGIKQALTVEAKELLPKRVELMASENDFSYNSVNIKSMRSRWGSCNSQKNISLNCYLMEMPWHIIDYVILHELCHTKYLNHSFDFWDLVKTYMPDYKQRKKELKILQNRVHQIQV